MQKHQFVSALFLGALFLLANPTKINAQCNTWNDHEEKDDILGSYSVLQDFMDAETYDTALEYWQNVYTKAPAGSGENASVFQYGRQIYIAFLQNETDATKRQEYVDMITKLHMEEMECFPDNKGVALANLAFDMFYYLQVPYSKLIETVEQSIDVLGTKAEYSIFIPYGYAAVYQYQNKFIDAEKARNIYLQLEEIIDARTADKDPYLDYYNDAWANVKAQFASIETEIFDCNYYQNKFRPDFEAGEEDVEVLKYMVVMMTKQGCADDDAFVVQVRTKYEELAAAINAEKLQEFYAENPAAHAADLYKEGNYDEAIAKYEEAIAKEEAGEKNSDNLAQYYFAMASIKGRKLKQYSNARSLALKAAGFKSGWGQPYMLIGDLYASSSRNCGSSDWDHSVAVLAAIDKYQYAKSIDSEIAGEANKKIANYRDFMPDGETGFMMGVKEGQKVKVNCWIGEKVKVRFN